MISEGDYVDPLDTIQGSYRHHPVSDMEPEESTVNSYREASLKSIFIMNRAYDFVMNSDNRIVALWQSAFALGLACCEGTSMTRAGELCGVSRACISKGARRFCELNDLPPSFYMKSEEVVDKAKTVRNSQL